MTVALRAAGTPTGATAAVTAINPSPPAGWQSGDISILAVQVKPDTASITTPANWTKIGEWTGGTGAVGVDTGPTKTAMYYRTDSPTAPGNISFSGASAAAAVIHIFSKTLAQWNVANFTSAADTSHAANVATATGSNITLANGDMLLVNWAGANDGGALSAPAVAATGSTFGTVTKRSEVSVTTGNDVMGAVFTAPVTGGPSTGGPSFSATNTLNSSSGHASFLRLRDVEAIPHGAATGTISVTGTASGHVLRHGSSVDTISITGTATGYTLRHGSSVGVITITGTTSGHKVPRGSAAGVVILTGTATGSHTSRGSATGVVSVSGSATGYAVHRGSATGSIAVIGAASGHTLRHGTATGTVAIAGSASGHTVTKNVAVGVIVITGSASGHAPQRDITVSAYIVPPAWVAGIADAPWAASLAPLTFEAEVVIE